ncbi:ATP-binding protein, partial [Cryptosporangium minutisporangium]
LAEVTEDARVTDAVATALGLRIGGGPAPRAVADALADRPLLLLLDNCEHVIAACRELVTALLTRAPGLRVLATSRVTLHVPGEYVVRLQPLPLPRSTSTLGELAHQPGVRAFVEHARRRDPAFALTTGDADAVVEVIRRIDGLPLAIELAAGQLAVLPPTALRDRLGRALDALSADRPEGDARHRTLRTTIDWSYRLLDDAERALLRALATFPGGAELSTVEKLAAEAAPGTDPLVPLSRLVDASFVLPERRDGDARYRMLETVRAFALEDAAARGERDAAERAFLAWARETARSLGAGLNGPDETPWDRRLRAELANLRAARDLARARDDLDLIVDVTLALDEAAIYRDLEELWNWSVELADEPGLREHPRAAA